jgi:MFS family permease
MSVPSGLTRRVMAALMIPGGKLTDRYGRKRCFTVGLVIYGIGALLSAAAPGLIGLAASVFLPAVLAPPAAAGSAPENLPRPLGTT